MPSQDQPSRPRRSLTRIILFVVVLIIAHAIMIVILEMTIFKVRTPKYRFDSVSLTDVNTNSTSSTSSSLRMKLNAQATIKNKNFGPYKYYDCYLTIFYRGKSVGEVVVKEAKVKTLSIKKLTLSVNVTYSESAVSGKSNLKSDISSGALIMSSKSEMRGRVKLLKIIPKDRQPKMQCTMSINLAQKVVRDLKCD
ncbi:late embryogenesis abundant protein-like [Heracleum sosnowskyi]|uniref:Late embryogenesis abundant protein-like n=1 Tax=Heracleum sosnowskyi TaxID=360622 RepID=A0AAD8ISM9_9APIA|nr:late embryogenesis abundant protein-like [Heracleum sosnowskyi]